MTLYYIYYDPQGKQYEIYQTRESGLVGTCEEIGDSERLYYFACFTRYIDASNYVRQENEQLRQRASYTTHVRRDWVEP